MDALVGFCSQQSIQDSLSRAASYVRQNCWGVTVGLVIEG